MPLTMRIRSKVFGMEAYLRYVYNNVVLAYKQIQHVCIHANITIRFILFVQEYHN